MLQNFTFSFWTKTGLVKFGISTKKNFYCENVKYDVICFSHNTMFLLYQMYSDLVSVTPAKKMLFCKKKRLGQSQSQNTNGYVSRSEFFVIT